MSYGRLCRYFSDRRWADQFIDGHLLFRSLAYFRDYEDGRIRGDQHEGTAVHRPAGGLVINNQTQRTTIHLPDHTFESGAKQGEIFAYCLSRKISDELRDEFDAAVCVEITDVAAFCGRVQKALPTGSKFAGRPGCKRLGHRVEYYSIDGPSTPRWARPDLIAISKLDHFSRQAEFRLVFSETDALELQKVDTRLVPIGDRRPANSAEHHEHIVHTPSLRDICRIHEW